MQLRKMIMGLVVSGSVCASAFAATAKTYQVTGEVLQVSDTMIVVQKDTEKWEIQRTPDTKIDGTLKVGEKVTIHYRMTATSVEQKSSSKSSDK